MNRKLKMNSPKSNIYSLNDGRERKRQVSDTETRLDKLEIENNELAFEVKRLTQTLNKLLRLLKAERAKTL